MRRKKCACSEFETPNGRSVPHVATFTRGALRFRPRKNEAGVLLPSRVHPRVLRWSMDFGFLVCNTFKAGMTVGATQTVLSIIAGILLLVVGFGFHFIGQAISLWSWPLAERLGLQEKGASPAQKDYEAGIATADVLIGWSYGPIGLGLILGWSWAYMAAILPSAILIYHALGFWFWNAAQNRGGRRIMAEPIRRVWTAVNLVTGLLVMASAWIGRA